MNEAELENRLKSLNDEMRVISEKISVIVRTVPIDDNQIKEVNSLHIEREKLVLKYIETEIALMSLKLESKKAELLHFQSLMNQYYGGK